MKTIMEITSLSASIHTTRKNIIARMDAIDQMIDAADVPNGIVAEAMLESSDTHTYRLEISRKSGLHVSADDGYVRKALAWDDVPERLARRIATEFPGMLEKYLENLRESATATAEALEKIIK
jgi:ATP phosphoribosyltransferase